MPHGRERPARLGPALLAGALLAGCATRPHQTYRSQNQYLKTGAVETRTWSNLAEVGTRGTLGEGLEVRVDERLVHTETSVDVPGSGDFDQTTIVHQPSVDLRTTVGALVWEQGFEYRGTEDRSDAFPDNDQTRTDLLQRLEWTPAPELPQVTTWISHRTLEDARSIDQERTEAVFELDQSLGTLGYGYTFEHEVITEEIIDSERDREEHIFTVNHADTYLDGRLSSSLDLYLGERDTTVTSSTGTGTVQIFPLTGLSLVDSTPQVATLAVTPALIDGDDATPTGINVGGGLAGGQLNWNIGAEVLPGTTIDEIRLFTAAVVDPLFRNQFTFSLWTSTDNNFWTLASPSVQVVYEPALRQFRILLPALSARYVKLVNTSLPAGAPAVEVTELQLFVGALSGGAGTRRTGFDESKRSLTGNLSWRPNDAFLLSYDLFAQTFRTEDGGVLTRDSVRVDNGLTAFWTPDPLVDVTARAEARSENDDIQRDEDFHVLNGIVATHPLETLDVILNLTHTERELDDRDDLLTDAAQLTGSAQLLDTLQLDLGIELNTQDDVTNQREIERTILSAGLFAALTPRLDMTLSLQNSDADVRGPGGAAIPDPSEERYEVLFLYRPSDRFTAELRLEYVDQFVGQGLDQRYRLDWVPFRDGSIDVQLDYEHLNARSVFDEQIDRYALLTRWTMNPSAFLELNAAREEIQGGLNTTLATLALNVNL